MRMTKRSVRALLPITAMLMGTAMPGLAATERAPDAEQAQSSRRPDWILLAVAGVAFIVGRTVIQRRYKRGGGRPR